jgi:hypothetical protein
MGEQFDIFGGTTPITPTRRTAPAPRPRVEQLGLFADESGELGGQTAVTDVFGADVDGGVLVASTKTTVRIRK